MILRRYAAIVLLLIFLSFARDAARTTGPAQLQPLIQTIRFSASRTKA